MTRLKSGTLLLIAGMASSAGAQSVPQIRLGAPTDFASAEFSRIIDVRELSDGRLIVTDAIEKQAYVVDFAKGASRKVGRQGAGPGEYRTPGRLLPIGGDSTLLLDNLGGRWLVMARDSFVAVVGGSEPAMAAGRSPLGADAHGHLLGNKPARSLDGAVGNLQMTNDSSWLVVVYRQSGKLDTVAKYRTRPARVNIKGTSERPTSISIVMNPITTGELPAMFADGAVAIARLDPYRVDWIIAGKTIAGRPLPFDAIPVDRDEKVAALARVSRGDSDTPRNPDDVQDWPEVIPPFLTGAVQPAADGTLWIRRMPTTKAPGNDYDIVDRSGRLVKRLHLPTNELVVAVGRTFLYVVTTDEDDLQHLRRYALSK